MIEINLPAILTQEFVSLIPRQRAHINELMEEGRVLNYTLALNRAKLWVIAVAENEEEANDILALFPLFRFMKFKVFELAFHQSISMGLPAISLN